MDEKEIFVEEKPEGTGVSSEVTGSARAEKYKGSLKHKERLYEESGRPYILGPFGDKRYFCETVGCGKFVIKGETHCKKHRRHGEGTLQSQEVLPELKMIRRFIRDFLKDATAQDPKLHIKLSELEKSVSILSDKMQTVLTAEHLRQAGFYFGSILFQYITDGNRYEMAKRDYLDCLRKIGCFTKDDMESIEKSGNAHTTPVS